MPFENVTPTQVTRVSPEEQQKLLASGLPAEAVERLVRDRETLAKIHEARQGREEDWKKQQEEQKLLAETTPISVEEATKLTSAVGLETEAPPIDIVSEWDAKTLANNPDFSFESYVSQNPDVMQDNAKVAKLSEAWKIRKTTPIEVKDVAIGVAKLFPSTVKAIGRFSAGTGQTLVDVFSIPGQVALGAVTGQPESYYTELGKIQEKQLSEDLAGFEKGTFGFAQFVNRAAKGAARKVGAMRDIEELSPEELQTEFRNEMANFVQAEKVGAGEVALAPSLVSETIREQGPLDPERVNRVAEADPVGFFMFGQLFGGLGAGVKAFKGAVKGTVEGGQMLARLRQATAELKQSLPAGDITRDFAEGLLSVAEKQAGTGAKAVAAFEESALGRQLKAMGQASTDLADASLRTGLAQKAVQAVPNAANRAALESAQTALQTATSAAEQVFGARTLATLQRGLANVSPAGVGVQAAGRGLGAAGVGLRAAAKVVEAAPAVAGAVGGLVSLFQGNVLAAGGLFFGSRIAPVRAVAKGLAKPLRMAGERLELVGKGIRTTPTSGFQQALRGIAQGSAETVAEGLKGVPLDVGFGLALAESPEEIQNIPAFGAAFRTMGAMGRPITRFIQAVKAGPRAPQAAFVSRQGGNFRAAQMVSEQNRRMLAPDQQTWLAATEQFLRDTGSRAPVLLLTEPTQVLDFLRSDFTRRYGREPNQQEAQMLQNASEQRGIFADNWVGEDGRPGSAIIVTDPSTAPHEAKHAFQAMLGENGNAFTDQLVRSHYTDAEWEQFGRSYAEGIRGSSVEDWRSVVQPLNPTISPDVYLAREIAAEHFDTLFKATGGQPMKPELTRALANVVDRVAKFFGVDLMQDVRTEGQRLPVSGELLGTVEQQVRGARAEPAPAGVQPRPIGTPNIRIPPVEGRVVDEFQARTPERLNINMAREQAAQRMDADAQQVVEDIGQALQRQPGEPVVMNITYRSAIPQGPEETLSRTARRFTQEQAKLAELTGVAPESVRDFYEKRVAVTRFLMDEFSGGKLQLASMSLEKVLANVIQLQQRLQKAGIASESPYEVDPNTGGLTQRGWDNFTADLISYTANQANGYRGGGREIVLPAEAAQLKIAVPEVTPNYRPTMLPDRAEQYLNTVMGIPIPKTAREFKGIVPGSVKGQILREAQGEVTLEPGDLIKRQPGKQAFKSYPGRVVREVNPWRQSLEARGVNTRDLFEVVERLNVDRIQQAVPQYELRFNLPTTDVIRAGFLPKDTTKATEENRRRGVSMAALRMPNGEILTGHSHFEALLQGINRGLLPEGSLEKGVQATGLQDGFVDFDGNFLTREQALQRAGEAEQLSAEEWKEVYQTPELESQIFSESRAFMPAHRIEGDTVKLYRGQEERGAARGVWWTRNPQKAANFAAGGEVYELTVPASVAYDAKRRAEQQGQGGDTYLLPPGYEREALPTKVEAPVFQLQPKISELRDKAKQNLPLTKNERILLANSTSRNWDKLTAAAQALTEAVKPSEGAVLDFGAGKNAIQTKLLRDQGYDVTAHEFGGNVNPQLHDRDALSRRYPVVMASNVLNVQSSPEMLRGTLQDMAAALDTGGKILANFPDTPRYLDKKAGDLQKRLEKYFDSVERVGGTAEEPVWELKDPKFESIPPRPVRRAVEELSTTKISGRANPEIAEPLQESGVPATPDGSVPAGPALQFMVRSYEEWLDKYFFNNEEAKKTYSKEEMESFAKGMRATAKIFGDFSTVPEPAPGNPIRGNQDPKFVATFDLTTVCPKQDQFVALVKTLEAERGRMFTAKEKALIGEMIRESGGTAPCWICYGQSARNLWDEAVQIFTDIVNRAVQEPNWVKATPKRKQEVFRSWNPKGVLGRYLDANMEELKNQGLPTAPELKAMMRGERAPSTDFEKEFVSTASHVVQGATKANPPKGYAEYTDQLKGAAGKRMVDRFNDIAGFRMNSQSDFRIWHIIDTAQFLTDLAQQDGQAHVYTRMEPFLRIFGKTGIKFNMSVEVTDPVSLPLEARYGKLTEGEFKTLFTEHGKPTWNDMDCFPEARVDYWREKLPMDAGSLLVALNDYQLWWGLNDPKIDMIIPYHQGAVKPEITAAYGGRDYRAEQHEHFPKDWKPGESRTVKLKDGSEVTLAMGRKKEHGKEVRVSPVIVRKHHHNSRERYLEICDKLKITPQFNRFRDHPNYMKLVRDVAREPMKQRVVDPTKIDWDEAMKIVDEWVESGSYEAKTKPNPAVLKLVRARIEAGEWPVGPVVAAGFAKTISELMAKKKEIKKLELKKKD